MDDLLAAIATHLDPTAHHLISPFAGFASIELNSPYPHLTLCDANPATVAALVTIRDEMEWLISFLQTELSWSRDCFEMAKMGMEPDTLTRTQGLSAIACIPACVAIKAKGGKQ